MVGGDGGPAQMPPAERLGSHGSVGSEPHRPERAQVAARLEEPLQEEIHGPRVGE